jgi:arsenate reductase
MILYGIPTCENCKKALKALTAIGQFVEFRDIRANPLSEDEIAHLVHEFGDHIINKSSTTWRGLSDWLRASEPEAQLASQPTLMKRPVILKSGHYYIGWDDEVQNSVMT